ncbi:hypothetical protein BP6252_03515 [Coleophoma cylindrospora]|uniref:Uncharacterized protein n=1 Tax=Coleophoma cylindrospora TaxID=1849047 RepID=A0A3D8S7W6_9HELO|nr:hypothetical protein BP6252_03515 [Coleophoma cylindrospora]
MDFRIYLRLVIYSGTNAAHQNQHPKQNPNDNIPLLPPLITLAPSHSFPPASHLLVAQTLHAPPARLIRRPAHVLRPILGTLAPQGNGIPAASHPPGAARPAADLRLDPREQRQCDVQDVQRVPERAQPADSAHVVLGAGHPASVAPEDAEKQVGYPDAEIAGGEVGRGLQTGGGVQEGEDELVGVLEVQEDDELEGDELGQRLVWLQRGLHAAVEVQDRHDTQDGRDGRDNHHPDVGEVDVVGRATVVPCGQGDDGDNPHEDGDGDELEDEEGSLLGRVKAGFWVLEWADRTYAVPAKTSTSLRYTLPVLQLQLCEEDLAAVQILIGHAVRGHEQEKRGQREGLHHAQSRLQILGGRVRRVLDYEEESHDGSEHRAAAADDDGERVEGQVPNYGDDSGIIAGVGHGAGHVCFRLMVAHYISEVGGRGAGEAFVAGEGSEVSRYEEGNENGYGLTQ